MISTVNPDTRQSQLFEAFARQLTIPVTYAGVRYEFRVQTIAYLRPYVYSVVCRMPAKPPVDTLWTVDCRTGWKFERMIGG